MWSSFEGDIFQFYTCHQNETLETKFGLKKKKTKALILALWKNTVHHAMFTSMMAFITSPAPFTMAIDGCWRKQNVFDWSTSLIRFIVAVIKQFKWNLKKKPERVWTACVRWMPPSPAACQTADPQWFHCRGRTGQRLRSPVRSWWPELLSRGPGD